jgi:hypothetical protein
MKFAKFRTEAFGQSWAVNGVSVLGGLVIAPILVEAATILLERSGQFPGSPEGVVLIAILPILLSLFVIGVGGGLLASWVAGLPYFVLAAQELWCYSEGLCAPPPIMAGVLPLALVSAIITGTIGYALSKAVLAVTGKTN